MVLPVHSPPSASSSPALLAFSEHVPIIHIVGIPNTLQLKTKPLLHHTLGDGRFVNLTSIRIRSVSLLIMLNTYRFDAYQKASEQFTISQAYLTRKENADMEIDRVLTDCITTVRRNVRLMRYSLLMWNCSCAGTTGVSHPPHRCRV